MQYHYLLLFLQGRRGVEIVLFWVRGGLTGRGRGKNNVIDFLKRGGGSIILFSEKELKPEGRGRGRGGGGIILFFLQGRGEGGILLFGCEVG